MTYLYAQPNVRVTGRRVVATLLDGIVLGAIASLLARFFGTGRPSSGFDMTTLTFGGGLRLFVVVLLYYTLLEGLTGRTVGKFVTGIRVVDAQTGRVPGLLSGFVRTLWRLIDGILAYLVGFLIVINSDRRRRLGDMFAKTLVVRA
ncbi:RDD family protein [Actinoplanes sp. KI2]|uniref:RDD family protein n=1 Tax=Actinoplanes sp. KI2 TaxID=2983315 RepID=UPI0021D593E1|nr:RDD family protein [Actinoplanes sp. KI2]MCU7728640.1 RDD family protein [Actinoplanes sp. KI2]